MTTAWLTAATAQSNARPVTMPARTWGTFARQDASSSRIGLPPSSRLPEAQDRRTRAGVGSWRRSTDGYGLGRDRLVDIGCPQRKAELPLAGRRQVHLADRVVERDRQ